MSASSENKLWVIHNPDSLKVYRYFNSMKACKAQFDTWCQDPKVKVPIQIGRFSEIKPKLEVLRLLSQKEI